MHVPQFGQCGTVPGERLLGLPKDHFGQQNSSQRESAVYGPEDTPDAFVVELMQNEHHRHDFRGSLQLCRRDLEGHCIADEQAYGSGFIASPSSLGDGAVRDVHADHLCQVRVPREIRREGTGPASKIEHRGAIRPQQRSHGEPVIETRRDVFGGHRVVLVVPGNSDAVALITADQPVKLADRLVIGHRGVDCRSEPGKLAELAHAKMAAPDLLENLCLCQVLQRRLKLHGVESGQGGWRDTVLRSQLRQETAFFQGDQNVERDVVADRGCQRLTMSPQFDSITVTGDAEHRPYISQAAQHGLSFNTWGHFSATGTHCHLSWTDAGVVGVTGFEPATPASRTQYSTRLSYTPNRTGANAQEGALRELLVITLDREGRQF